MFLSFVVASMFSRCGTHKEDAPVAPADEDATYRDDVAAGVIGGQAWTFRGGFAEPDRGKSDMMQIWLFDKPISDPCNPFGRTAPGDRYVAFSVARNAEENVFPTSDKEYVSIGRPVDTVVKIELAAAKVLINSASNEISGQIMAKANDDNMVNGTFRVTFCKEDSLTPSPAAASSPTPFPSPIPSPRPIGALRGSCGSSYLGAIDGKIKIFWLEDYHSRWFVDNAVNPGRIDEYFESVATSTVNGISAGQHRRCIYQFVDTAIQIACSAPGTPAYPADFSSSRQYKRPENDRKSSGENLNF